MALALQPFVLTDTSLTLIKSSDLLTGVEQEYICQLTQAQITPSAGSSGGGSDLVTFCGTYPSGGASSGSTFKLDLSGFQAWQDAADLTYLLWEEEGQKYTFTLVPIGPLPISTTNPGFTGEVTLSPSAVGGTAKQHATFTVSLDCVAKPQIITVP